MAALSGVAAGATAGGVAGALVGLGIPEYEAKVYEEKLRKGNYLIAVHAADDHQTSSIKEIFKTEGAEDVSSAHEAAPPK